MCKFVKLSPSPPYSTARAAKMKRPGSPEKKGVQCGYKKNRWREIEWLIEKIRQIQLDSSEEEGPTDPVKVLPEAGVNNLDSHLHLLATSIQHTSPIHLHTQ